MDINDKQPFIEHLAELRKRLTIILAAVIIASLISYTYVQILIENVIKLADNKIDFIYISPPELFLAYIKLSVISGIAISFPIVVYQIYKFVRPGLEKRERRYLLASLIGGTMLFIIGVVFSYLVVLPTVLKFFVNIRIEEINPVMSVGNYLDFISTSLLSFGIVFEMPMLILLLANFGLVTSEFLKKNIKYMVLIIFIIAAIITPPDVVSQILLALPMLILYQISIMLAKWVEKRKKVNLQTDLK